MQSDDKTESDIFIIPDTDDYGEKKRVEMMDILGFNPGSAYGRCMAGIRQQAIEKFKRNQSEYNSQRMK
jgi:hypothetical protein